MALIDTNYIIRYLLHDLDEQYQIAAEVLSNQELTLLPEVLMECIFVLEHHYKIDRETLVTALQDVIQGYNIVLDNKHLYLQALELYKNSPVSYVDGLIFLSAKENELPVYTFDKKLNNLITQG